MLVGSKRRYTASRPALAVRVAAESSRTTHGGRAAIDAGRYFAGLVVSLLAGRPKEEMLADQYTPVAGLWVEAPLHDEVAAIAGGSFRRKAPPKLRAGSGYVVHTLEAALWALGGVAGRPRYDALIRRVNLRPARIP